MRLLLACATALCAASWSPGTVLAYTHRTKLPVTEYGRTPYSGTVYNGTARMLPNGQWQPRNNSVIQRSSGAPASTACRGSRAATCNAASARRPGAHRHP